MNTRNPIVVDLFSGCGGLSHGFIKYGFTVIEYENNDKACIVSAKNGHHVIKTNLDENTEIIHPDILIGGPPCQPFSVIGNQNGQYDKRDGLPIFISMMKKYKPLIAIIENVPNLTGKKHNIYFKTIINEIKNIGYHVDWKILNALDYGIPQNRKRLFIVAHNGQFNFPSQSNHKITTVGDVIPKNSFSAQTCDIYPELILTESMDKYISNYEKKSKCVNPRDLHPNKPSRTLTCRNLQACTSDMIRIVLDNGKRRQLTVEEACLIQTFPTDYFTSVDRKSAMKMIGNSVPPLLSEKLAYQVILYLQQLLNNTTY